MSTASPTAPMSEVTRSTASASMSVTTTLAPSCTKRRANASPMPLPEPVTTTTLSLSFMRYQRSQCTTVLTSGVGTGLKSVPTV